MVHARIALLILGLAPLVAGAEIYKCVDESGRASYTNVKREVGKNCKLVSGDVIVVPATKPKAGSPDVRVDGDTQRKRDEARRQILEKELADEEKLLVESKKKLAEQETVRYGDERNYQRVLDRLKPFQDEVVLHEKNVAALKQEISRLK
ncbi:MAG: DUF4124 domain-containing protein [Betaproteobacteria bacterium]|nr:DUF4124 domain-containing protein [Betaproteobacteria bacterium]